MFTSPTNTWKDYIYFVFVLFLIFYICGWLFEYSKDCKPVLEPTSTGDNQYIVIEKINNHIFKKFEINTRNVGAALTLGCK